MCHICKDISNSYVQLNTIVKNVLPSAHGEAAIQSAFANYIYCSKSNHFDVFGDFRAEQAAYFQGTTATHIHNHNFIKGLLSNKCKLQVMASAEYFKNHIYYKIVRNFVK